MKNKCKQTLFETSSTYNDFVNGVARAKCIDCGHEILITTQLIKSLLKKPKSLIIKHKNI